MAVAGLAAMLTLGCDPIVTSRTPSKPLGPLHLTLTGFKLPSDTLIAGGSYPVSGLLETDGAFTQVDYDLFKGDSLISFQKDVLLYFLNLEPGRSKWDLRTEGDLRIVTLPTAQEGAYTLQVKAVVGDSVRRFSLKFSVYPEFEPKTTATITGIWRTNINLPTTPPTILKVTMQIDAGGTLILSQLLATGQPSPYDFVNVSREVMDWTLVEGAMHTVKTNCAYRDPVTFQPTEETECRAPLENTSPILVSKGAWSFTDSGTTLIFNKD